MYSLTKVSWGAMLAQFQGNRCKGGHVPISLWIVNDSQKHSLEAVLFCVWKQWHLGFHFCPPFHQGKQIDTLKVTELWEQIHHSVCTNGFEINSNQIPQSKKTASCSFPVLGSHLGVSSGGTSFWYCSKSWSQVWRSKENLWNSGRGKFS